MIAIHDGCVSSFPIPLKKKSFYIILDRVCAWLMIFNFFCLVRTKSTILLPRFQSLFCIHVPTQHLCPSPPNSCQQTKSTWWPCKTLCACMCPTPPVPPPAAAQAATRAGQHRWEAGGWARPACACWRKCSIFWAVCRTARWHWPVPTGWSRSYPWVSEG